jgi:hypothetical protein
MFFKNLSKVLSRSARSTISAFVDYFSSKTFEKEAMQIVDTIIVLSKNKKATKKLIKKLTSLIESTFDGIVNASDNIQQRKTINAACSVLVSFVKNNRDTIIHIMTSATNATNDKIARTMLMKFNERVDELLGYVEEFKDPTNNSMHPLYKTIVKAIDTDGVSAIAKVRRFLDNKSKDFDAVTFRIFCQGLIRKISKLAGKKKSFLLRLVSPLRSMY